MGPRAKNWLTSFFDRIVQEKIPRARRQAKIIAVPKSGKDHSIAANCRPISLLSVCFKVMERLILHRISPTLDDSIVVEQAGLRHGRSTCDQVLALTTFIENGFQRKQKTGMIFLDLTSRRHSLALGPSNETFQSHTTVGCRQYCTVPSSQTLSSSHWQVSKDTNVRSKAGS